MLGYPREAGYGVCFVFFISVFSAFSLVRIDTGRPMEVKEKAIQSVARAGLNSQVCSPWSCPRSCIQKGPTLHLMLCCCYPEIFDNFFFFFTKKPYIFILHLALLSTEPVLTRRQLNADLLTTLSIATGLAGFPTSRRKASSLQIGGAAKQLQVCWGAVP